MLRGRHFNFLIDTKKALTGCVSAFGFHLTILLTLIQKSPQRESVSLTVHININSFRT